MLDDPPTKDVAVFMGIMIGVAVSVMAACGVLAACIVAFLTDDSPIC